MPPVSASQLASWANFYVIIGSAAGALTGLQFVVMTLISGARKPGTMQEVRAFGTPTLVFFCATLLVSALMAAPGPWPSVSHLGLCLAVFAGFGFLYGLRVIWHARKSAYNPDWEDWIWYCILPLLSFLLLAAAGCLLYRQVAASPFLIAAATLIFLVIGIHNAWDAVTYIALQREQA